VSIITPMLHTHLHLRVAISRKKSGRSLRYETSIKKSSFEIGGEFDIVVLLHICARFEICAAVNLRSSLFWDCMRLRFGYSRLQTCCVTLTVGPMYVPETSVTTCHLTSRNIPQDRKSHFFFWRAEDLLSYKT
jgi:hypothetical protein